MTDTGWPTAEQAHPLAHLIPELRIADRCDRCGAQAFMAALIRAKDEHPLLFCAHHGAAHLLVLQRTAVAVRDERHKINAEASTSANV